MDQTRKRDRHTDSAITICLPKFLWGHKNIINDPNCECGEIEDTEHYPLNCNLFQNLREEVLNTGTTYCQPTLNVLLYGNANLSESENKTIFSAVQEFILKTKRF